MPEKFLDILKVELFINSILYLHYIFVFIDNKFTNYHHSTMYILLLLFIFILRSLTWLYENFGVLTIEQLLFHIGSGQNNLGQNAINQALFKSYFISVCESLIIFLVLYATVYFLNLKKYIQNFPKYIKVLIVTAGAVYCLIAVERQIKVYDFLLSRFGEDVFQKLYAKPEIKNYTLVGQKRNLIVVFVESMEWSFLDSSFIDQRLNNMFNEIPGEEVHEFSQASGTGWSLAGMISSNCALPVMPYVENSLSGNRPRTKVLENAICIGDILKLNNYTQAFFVGSDASFGWMDKFYTSHGFDLVVGKNELIKQGVAKNLMTSWDEGAHDDTVLESAFEQIQKYHQNNNLFNVNISLVDNHLPNGIHSSRCTKEERDMKHRGAILCSSRAVNAFAMKLKKSGILNNTVLVVMGDHLYPNVTIDDKKILGDRYIYFKISTPDVWPKARQQMTHFDLPATLLQVMGFAVDPRKPFGLGYSIFMEDKNTWIEHYELLKSKKLLNKSDYYYTLWGAIPKKNNIPTLY